MGVVDPAALSYVGFRMSDPVSTLVVFATAIGLAALVLHASLWRARLPGVSEWAASAALACVSVLLPESGLPLGTASIGACAVLTGAAALASFHAGCVRFGGARPKRREFGAAFAALAVALLGASLMGEAGVAFAAFARGIYASAFCALIVRGLLGALASTQILHPRRVTAAIAGGYALCAIAQGAAGLAHDTPVLLPALGAVALTMLPLAALMLVHDTLLQRAGEGAAGDAGIGLIARDAFEARVREQLADPHAAGPAVLLLLEIDHVARTRAALGEAGVDAVLHDFAQLALAQIGPQLDARAALSRLDGATFGVLLPGLPAREAWQAGERLRAAAAARRVATPAGDHAYTISGGIAAAQAGDTFERLHARVDMALYEAQQTGRDAIRVAHSALAGAATGA